MFGRISPWKLLTGLIRLLFSALVLFIVIFFIWRAASYHHDPKDLTTLLVDDTLAQAYDTYGDGLKLFTQEQGTYTRAERNNGYFYMRQALFIPEAEQVQILFRYNNSTIDALVEDYGLAEIPDRSEHLYDLSIVIKKDLTPDIVDDYDEEGCYTLERYYPSESASGVQNLYNYRKVIFNDVAVDDTTLAVFVDIYYVGDINYDEPAYGTLCIWDFMSENKPRKLSSADKAALAEY